MKIKFLSLAIVASALLSVFAIPSKAQENAKETVAIENSSKDSKDESKKERKANSIMRLNAKMFEGIDLTDEQKEKIEALQASLRPEKVEKKDDETKEMVSDEEKKFRAMEKVAKMKEGRAKYLEGLKKILTPDQYVKFLENNFLNQTDSKKMDPRNPKVMKDPRERGGKHYKGPKTEDRKKEDKMKKEKRKKRD